MQVYFFDIKVGSLKISIGTSAKRSSGLAGLLVDVDLDEVKQTDELPGRQRAPMTINLLRSLPLKSDLRMTPATAHPEPRRSKETLRLARSRLF